MVLMRIYGCTCAHVARPQELKDAWSKLAAEAPALVQSRLSLIAMCCAYTADPQARTGTDANTRQVQALGTDDIR